MKLNKRMKRAGTATAGLAGLTVAAAVLPMEGVQSGANSWAASLSDAERKWYMEPERLAAIPPEYRRAVAHMGASPEHQVKFWRSVFAGFRQSHSLSAAQEEVLNRTESLLTVALFSKDGNVQEKRQRIAKARSEIAATFDESVADELFQAGGPRTVVDPKLPQWERIVRAMRIQRPRAMMALSNYLAPIAYATSCNCADNGDCYYSTVCGAPGCTPTDSWPPFGCGNWNSNPCTSLCYYS